MASNFPSRQNLGQLSSSARKSFYFQEVVNKLESMRLTGPMYYFCPVGCDQRQNGGGPFRELPGAERSLEMSDDRKNIFF